MWGFFSTLSNYLSYGFIRNAFLVGAMIALCAALLGVPLVLRRQSMLGDGLSHVAFGALAIGTVLRSAPLAFSLPIVILSAVILLRISEKSRVSGDAAIAMISTSALAVGVTAISLSGTNTDVSAYMFGSLSAISRDDLVVSAVLLLAVLAFYILFFGRIFSFTFDESFAKATGLHAEIYKTVSAVITAITVVMGMRMMGAMLISALLIFPALTAMRLFRSFRSVIISAAVISVTSALIGTAASCVLSLPTGAAIVLTNATLFILFSLVSLIRKG